jgi:hypothetical protein
VGSSLSAPHPTPSFSDHTKQSNYRGCVSLGETGAMTSCLPIWVDRKKEFVGPRPFPGAISCMRHENLGKLCSGGSRHGRSASSSNRRWSCRSLQCRTATKVPVFSPITHGESVNVSSLGPPMLCKRSFSPGNARHLARRSQPSSRSCELSQSQSQRWWVLGFQELMEVDGADGKG